MWEVVGTPKEPGLFGRFEPIDVLIWYDYPRTFTLHDQDGGLCLAHWLDEDAEIMRYLVAPVTPKQIEQLKRGELSLLEGLEQPRVYVVDQANTGDTLSVWLTQVADVPQDALPVPRTMLHRSLEPILSLRATGETIKPGEIPGSVIKSTVEGAQKALKCLAEYEMDLPIRQGRPSRALQKLYDLPVQKTLAASFEVQFRSPLSEPTLFEGLAEGEIREEQDVLNRVADHLKVGLSWLTLTASEASALPVPNDKELSRVIIKALKFLTPSPRGAVRELEIRGDLATRTIEPVRLTRRSRGVVNGAISRLPAMTERRVELKGRIREINEKLMRFELHDVNQPPSPVRVCEFDAEIWDDVYEMLGVEESVDVLGLETSPSSIVRILNLKRP